MIARPTFRFSVIIEDGNDVRRTYLVRGRDAEHAITVAMRAIKRDLAEPRLDSSRLTDDVNYMRALKRLDPLYVFAGHVRQVGGTNAQTL